MTIDWISLIILGVAFGVGQIPSVPRYGREAVFAVACFAAAGFRVYRGLTGINALFTIGIVIYGCLSAFNAWKAYRVATASSPRE